MSKFLIFIPMPKDQAHLAEQTVRSATVFLEIQGKVERVSLGDFERQQGRKESAAEALKLVELRTPAAAKDEFARARMLEGVLRQTLASAGIRAPDVRVFVAEG